ncbi:TPA: hypothetical protein ACX387_004747 [Klebsiella pneumoniae]|uniref:hypothetical protein n=1 Tax=Klebsiella pneumoniae TaxID=573 RepID=UPI001083799A|nr:hypothetical protein [Klebsiella pneumoniae]EKW5906222.1 hypothetical protein [Klebsiella pneumoniae]EKZ6776209.1 hypothetical protein [Klebsiella pneumoniae]VGD73558.1 Uncharacterised protein [Klebsiella pneumoniae]VGH89115.1 Uncharacterised protein [Klebsiella pneumoniae]HED2301003.1 hypothetical protein [Klebsiella pneumoniae]
MVKEIEQNTPEEKCELCGKYAVLKNSHLMPKSLYKVITRTFHPYDSAPIWASKSQKSSYYSNSQITKKLLCGVCEDRFNKYGEKYVVEKCMKNPQTFELKRVLDSSTPSIHVNGFSYFNPKDILKFNSEKFMYFAASIAWRVTATNWGNDDIANLNNALPKEFKESLQNYLLKNVESPSNIYITVCVDNDVEPVPIMSLPSGDIEKNMCMSFFIPGIKFNIFFGAEADQELSSSLNKLGINLIYMYRSFRRSNEYQQMKNLLGSELSPKGKLAKQPNRS